MVKYEKVKVHRNANCEGIQEHDNGPRAGDICRELGITTASFYKWRQRYSGLEVKELKRLRELEEENARLKKCMPA